MRRAARGSTSEVKTSTAKVQSDRGVQPSTISTVRPGVVDGGFRSLRVKQALPGVAIPLR
jgi:hypothetical protein